MISKLISACGCMDFSSYFQAGSKSRSVGLGLSRWPPSAGQAPLAALRGSLGLDVYLSCETDVYIYDALLSSGLSWLIKRILLLLLLSLQQRAYSYKAYIMRDQDGSGTQTGGSSREWASRDWESCSRERAAVGLFNQTRATPTVTLANQSWC